MPGRSKRGSSKGRSSAANTSSKNEDLYTVEGMMEGEVSKEDRLANEYNSMLSDMRRVYRGRRTRDLKWRKKQLEGLKTILMKHASELHEALNKDLGLSAGNSQMLELDTAYGEVQEALENLDKWAHPEPKSVPLLQMPGSGRIVHEPLGVVLVITPWNVPVQLTINAVAATVAAGNACVMKPSEVSPNVSALWSKLIPQYLDEELVRVVEGAVPETTALLKLRWDMIHYTGNTFVGRIVMQAASKFLTPVILELGGKNPVVVDATADIEVSARRVVWGKYLNCGQLCTNCDYLMVDSSIKDKFVAACLKYIKQFYGENPKNSADYSRIINGRHVERITAILKSAENFGEVLSGGLESIDAKQCYIGPTVIALHNSVKEDIAVKRDHQTSNDGKAEPLFMREELFAPILFIREYDDIEEVYEYVELHEKPLASYIFSSSQRNIDDFIARVTSGGCAVNDIHMQVSCHDLPFGGVGCSGMGAYHGKEGFLQMTHKKSVLQKSTFGDPFVRYPPYTPFKLNAVYMLRYSLNKYLRIGKYLGVFLTLACLAYMLKYKLNFFGWLG